MEFPNLSSICWFSFWTPPKVQIGSIIYISPHMELLSPVRLAWSICVVQHKWIMPNVQVKVSIMLTYLYILVHQAKLYTDGSRNTASQVTLDSPTSYHPKSFLPGPTEPKSIIYVCQFLIHIGINIFKSCYTIISSLWLLNYETIGSQGWRLSTFDEIICGHISSIFTYDSHVDKSRHYRRPSSRIYDQTVRISPFV